MTVDLYQAVKLHQAGKLDQAEALYQAVLQQHPDQAKALHLWGVILFQRKTYREAIGLISQSLAVDATQADAHHNLALVYRILGNFADAEHHYLRAITLKPDYAEAYFNLTAVKHFADGEAIVSALESQLVLSAQYSAHDQTFLHFAAGKIYDDLGHYDQAFAHYQQGNQLVQRRYDRTAQDYLIEDLISLCGHAFFQARERWNLTPITPIFIVGMPRSGTTLVEQILSVHDHVVGLGELPDIPSMAQALSTRSSLPYPHCLKQLNQDIFQGFAQTYTRRIQSLAPHARYRIDKLPRNYLHLGLIALMFPQARVIHCHRHPLDTCLSCYFQLFRSGHDYAYDLGDLGHYYKTYRTLMEHWHQVLPIPIFDLEYEALVEDPEAVSQQLFAFCGLEGHPHYQEFHQVARPVTTASGWQVRQPLYQSAVHRWQHYQPYLSPLKAALNQDIKRSAE